MNRVFKITGITLVGLLVALVMVGCERSWCSKWHDPGRIMNKIDSEVKDLNLSKEQQVKYEGIRSRFEKDVRAHMDSMKGLHDELEKKLSGDNPDVNAMATQLKKRFAEEGDPRMKLVDYFVEFYTILDKDQQKKLLDHMGKERKCPFWRS